MDKCFSHCISLTEAPEIPDSIFTLKNCFDGCTSLSGIVKLPFIPYAPTDTWFENYDIYFRTPAITDFLKNCGNVDMIQIDYCPDVIDTSTFSTRIPIEFVGDHVAEGICGLCHFVTLTTTIDDVEVVIDHVTEDNYTHFILYFDNEVPDWLKSGCPRITFTDDLAKYEPKYIGDQWGGFASWPSGYAYVEDQWGFSGIPYTIVHELAHTYDHNYSTYGRYSSSSEWIYLHNREGATAASLWYGSSYDTKSITSQRKETFAMAVGKYFTNPGELKNRCPGMYEYIKELFEENQ